MQKQQGTQPPVAEKWLPSFFISKNALILLAVFVVSALFLSSGVAITRLHRSAIPDVNQTIALNGANSWQGDRRVTAPAFPFSSGQPVSVAPLFAAYYAAHSGAQSLGQPLTVAFPTGKGWLQFFMSGALLLPAPQPIYSAGDPLAALIDSGTSDPQTGVVRLPLLQALLTAGSQETIIDGAQLSYVDLRKATNPAGMQFAPTKAQGVFIRVGTRAGKDAGYVIPTPIWNYINRADIAPGGWRVDFGLPLTSAIALTASKNGSVHHLLVQLFLRDGVILDQNTLDATGQPLLQRLDTGLAYLHTFGLPPVEVNAQEPVWTQSKVTILNAPAGQPLAHLQSAFPLSLLGDTTWQGGMLWYHVQWTVPKQSYSGWAAATALTFTAPGHVAARASIDALSPALSAYLSDIGGNVDLVVYDITHQRYYTYNPGAQFITGSSMKVAIMLTFFNMIEQQGREPTDDEMNLLQTMIENSNNDSASALYYGEIGGAGGVASYAQSIGITGLNPDPDAWGYSVITPLAMVNLLTLLYEGKILTASHRRLAFYWMEHIEPDQQVGVGDTAPAGTTAAMKDGWLPGPDGLWAMNSSGIVMSKQETYIISVYTREQNSLADGQAIARHVCRTVASLLV